MIRKSMSRAASASTRSTISLEEADHSPTGNLPPTPPKSENSASVSSSQNDDRPHAPRAQRRAQRARTSATIHSEDSSGEHTRLRSSERVDVYNDRRDLLEKTLADRVEGGEERIQSLSGLAMSRADAARNMAGPTSAENHTKSGPLARSSSVLSKASQAITKPGFILGKRTRDSSESNRIRLPKLSQRTSPRSRGTGNLEESGPPSKRTRLAEKTSKEELQVVEPVQRKAVCVPRTKHWLTNGLYVGQDQDFDARFLEGKNKKTKAKKGSRISKIIIHRKILPMLMFAGKRLLEREREFKLPFDVYSPLPPGQPKPEEWRKTQRNVFVGDAAAEWKTAKLKEHSVCMCTAYSGCDENCLNRTMFYECDRYNCKLEPALCTNRSFEDLRKRCKAAKGGKYNIGVEVIKTLDRGYGVRSCRTFRPNQIIVEYTGEIITQEECDQRMHNTYKENECFYLMMFDQNMICDATRGSIARFVNHSCEPNCHMVKWTVEGKPRMALFAGDRGIMTGDELTYDYKFDPFSAMNIQMCRCGMPSCRGVLGPRPKEREAKEANLDPLIKNDLRIPRGAVAGSKRKALKKVPTLMTEPKQSARDCKRLLNRSLSFVSNVAQGKVVMRGLKAPLDKQRVPFGTCSRGGIRRTGTAPVSRKHNCAQTTKGLRRRAKVC